MGNEVEVIEDSSEVPNQSERAREQGSSHEEQLEQPQSEAISSGTDGQLNTLNSTNNLNAGKDKTCKFDEQLQIHITIWLRKKFRIN